MQEIIKTGITYLPFIIKGIKSFLSDDNEKTNNDDEHLEKKFSKKLEELKFEKEEMEKKNKQYEKRLEQLNEIMMNNNLERQKIKELERQIELIEIEKMRHQEEIEKNKRTQIAINECKVSLNNELTKGILKALRNYSAEEEKWLNKINNENIQKQLSSFKQKLTLLFQDLFIYEKINEKMTKEFIKILQKNTNKIELNKMNFMIIGSSGVGKSTLINQLLGEKLAEEGNGKRCTIIGTSYTSKKFPFLTLYDSVGTEIGEGHTLEKVQNETLDEITKNLNINDPNEHIHCIFYCTTSNRIFEDELKVILKIREKYDGKRLPIIIVFTRAIDEEDIESKKDIINEFLKKYGEEISDDIFGISFIKVHAKEKVGEKMGKKYCDPCFGLSELISLAYKKGEKSYKIAIKNSLVEIGKNTFYNYIQSISNYLSNNINFYLYLSKKFEPNFSDYISYSFEKITDIVNKEGVTENELEKLENYLGNKLFETKTNKIIIPKNENINSKEKICIYCENNPKNAYKCECGTFACEKCYLNLYEYNDSVTCLICGKSESYIQEKTNQIQDSIILETNNYNEYDNYDNDYENGTFSDYEEKKIFNDNKNFDSIINILPNNLSMESKNSIYESVIEFKEAMIKEVSLDFEKFIQNEVKNIYYEILEKYNENFINNGFNMKGAMKSKEEIMETAEKEIKNQLLKPAEENFLKKMSSNLFQEINTIFKNEMLNKVIEFINNLNNNKEVNKFIQNFDIIPNEDKNLKIKQQFDEYIDKLKQKEVESQEKALKYQYEDNINYSQGYSSVPFNSEPGYSSEPFNSEPSSNPFSNQ